MNFDPDSIVPSWGEERLQPRLEMCARLLYSHGFLTEKAYVKIRNNIKEAGNLVPAEGQAGQRS